MRTEARCERGCRERCSEEIGGGEEGFVVRVEAGDEDVVPERIEV